MKCKICKKKIEGKIALIHNERENAKEVCQFCYFKNKQRRLSGGRPTNKRRITKYWEDWMKR